MDAGTDRKNQTHALLVDFSIPSLEAAQNDLLDSLSLISAKAVPFSDAELQPDLAKLVQDEVKLYAWSMGVICRIVQGLPKEHELAGGLSCMLIRGRTSDSWMGHRMEREADAGRLFIEKKEFYNQVCIFPFFD